MRFSRFAHGALAASTFALFACSSSSPTSGFGQPGGKTNGSDPDAGGGGFFGDAGKDPGSFGEGGVAPPPTNTCVPSPGNYDIPGDNCDNDGDGKVDNAASCDTGLAQQGSAMDFAKAIGLCQTAGENDTKWGVISAEFTNGYGSTSAPNDQQHGILPKFGNVVKPQEGAALGVLSSGTATEEDGDRGPAFKDQKDGMQGKTKCTAPPGFPKATAGCGTGQKPPLYDLVDVKLRIRVPANAKGLSFKFDFWSGEWPEYVCSNFNDAFIAYLSAKGFNGGTPDNISFDAQNNPVSVNNGFFDRCTPNTTVGCATNPLSSKTAACAGGESELAGTGFGTTGTYCGLKASTSGGATGWLQSKAPVTPGEVITLEFMVWDAGDSSWDSSVLLDGFEWEPSPVTTGTTRPDPK